MTSGTCGSWRGDSAGGPYRTRLSNRVPVMDAGSYRNHYRQSLLTVRSVESRITCPRHTHTRRHDLHSRPKTHACLSSIRTALTMVTLVDARNSSLARGAVWTPMPPMRRSTIRRESRGPRSSPEPTERVLCNHDDLYRLMRQADDLKADTARLLRAIRLSRRLTLRQRGRVRPRP
jgi:hypothetical protein